MYINPLPSYIISDRSHVFSSIKPNYYIKRHDVKMVFLITVIYIIIFGIFQECKSSRKRNEQKDSQKVFRSYEDWSGV